MLLFELLEVGYVFLLDSPVENESPLKTSLMVKRMGRNIVYCINAVGGKSLFENSLWEIST